MLVLTNNSKKLTWDLRRGFRFYATPCVDVTLLLTSWIHKFVFIERAKHFAFTYSHSDKNMESTKRINMFVGLVNYITRVRKCWLFDITILYYTLQIQKEWNWIHFFFKGQSTSRDPWGGSLSRLVESEAANFQGRWVNFPDRSTSPTHKPCLIISKVWHIW